MTFALRVAESYRWALLASPSPLSWVKRAAVALTCGIYDSKHFFESFTYELFLQHKQLQTLTAFTVGQSQRHHLRSYCDLCETLHPSPVS